MALESEFLTMCSTSVSVYALSTHSNYGAPTYSTSAQTYTAAVEYGPRLIVTAVGREETAQATVYVMSSSARISVQDLVTLPRDTAARLLRVDTLNDDEGQHHLELYFA